MNEFILFDDAQNGNSFLLHNFCYQEIILADKLSELDKCLQLGWQKSLHCAVFMDYEFGLSLQKLDNSHSGCMKIVWFKQKSEIGQVENWLENQANNIPCAISTPQMNVSEDEYYQAIKKIHQHIMAGDSYQINYTVRLFLKAYGNPIQLYRHLRQKVPFGVLSRLPENYWVLSFSPELFLHIQANGVIKTQPMKGTAPILFDGMDKKRSYDLQNDPKNRAENTMIVDLLRNDLGKIAQIGSVSVPEMCQVNDFGHVWQMTSTVCAKLKEHTSLAEIFQATFPCGSITGAPKRKSMEIISQLESTPRGLYTGAIGFFSPENRETAMGVSGCLNVAIRTLELMPDNGAWQGVYGVGSGIVIDSVAENEYQECLWKSQFINNLRPNFDLFETMRVENGKISLLDKHLNRMSQSAFALNMPFSLSQAKDKIETALQNLCDDKTYRLKLILTCSGSLKTEYSPLNSLIGNKKVIISPNRLPNQNPLRCYKITYRPEYDKAWQDAEQVGAFDALLFNQNGDLLEGGRSSVMIFIENQWLTPDLSLHILPSIARGEFMQKNTVQESTININTLQRAEKILVGNALRGWLEVDLVV
ncbi:MAG: bifunctional anthranilate synthase component I family protein/aminotransferase class IV [Neisseriaceae bacterium]|nr:bifunctional anthranilate synthase component I family protein/aminotransferase class IV [Neisseriaceae bacterium]